MQRWHVSRTIEATPAAVWEVLTDVRQWPVWGPSIRSASIDTDELRLGSTGSVTTAVGIALPFVVTSFEPGRFWAWSVAGVPATDHRVEPIRDRTGCRLTFGAPWIVWPYLGICEVALRRIDRLGSAST